VRERVRARMESGGDEGEERSCEMTARPCLPVAPVIRMFMFEDRVVGRKDKREREGKSSEMGCTNAESRR
jgi:hypothetical protein